MGGRNRLGRWAPLLAAVVLGGCYLSHGPRDADGGAPLDADRMRCGATACAAGERCCPLCMGEAVCVGAREPCPAIVCTDECLRNADCAEGWYCAQEPGTCAGLGRCEPRPEGCFTECRGVCGCDGNDYCNECEAGQRGVSVRREGRCAERRFCHSPDGCDPDTYCRFMAPGCGGEDIGGTCEPRPTSCSPGPSVCGCDGAVYASACEAERAGTTESGWSEECRAATIARACADLCARAPSCGGGDPAECAAACPGALSGCEPRDSLRLVDCARLGGCDAIADCVAAVGCTLAP